MFSTTPSNHHCSLIKPSLSIKYLLQLLIQNDVTEIDEGRARLSRNTFLKSELFS